jgi:hypothetical protein
MFGKDKPALHASHDVTAITFLLLGIITTSIFFVFTLVLNQNHTAIAQQQKGMQNNQTSSSLAKQQLRKQNNR